MDIDSGSEYSVINEFFTLKTLEETCTRKELGLLNIWMVSR